MGTVTLIGTFHEERGRVNYSELNEIIERINPEVIFIEEPPSAWKGLAELSKTKPLEGAAISKYIETASAELVPVDLITAPEPYVRHVREVLGYVERVSDTFCQLIDFNKAKMESGGFTYLNGELHEQVNLSIRNEILRILDLRKSGALDKAYDAWRDQDERREVEMVGNIEKYFRGNRFERAIFLVGSAHRASIANKTNERASSGVANLHWDYSTHWYM